jgi:hypothetical protein
MEFISVEHLNRKQSTTKHGRKDFTPPHNYNATQNIQEDPN